MLNVSTVFGYKSSIVEITNKKYLLFLVLSILAMNCRWHFLYISIKRVIYRQIDESLITEKTIIQDQIEQTDTIPDFAATVGNQIEVKLFNYYMHKLQYIKDTDIYDSRTDSFNPFRYLYFSGNSIAKKRLYNYNCTNFK